MKILIAEDELYLAQSICNALGDSLPNSDITMVTTTNDAISQTKNFDIIILSSTLSGNIYDIIEKYNNSTIILLIPYRNHDTVIAPLSAGVDTYITKPLMIEELIRKINHHLEFKKLKKENHTYKAYFEMFFKGVEHNVDVEEVEFPLFVKSVSRKQIDKFVFDLSKKLGLPVSFYDLGDKFDLMEIKRDRNLLYFVNFDSLKANSISKLFDIISNKKVIIELKTSSSFEHPNLIIIETDEEEVDEEHIMTIEEYVKYVIRKYENKLPDTELAKRLGISRKSLWEKRRKHGLNKKKTIYR